MTVAPAGKIAGNAENKPPMAKLFDIDSCESRDQSNRNEPNHAFVPFSLTKSLKINY